MQEKAYITFGSQMGGVKAAEAVQPHLIELRRLLKKYCNKQYTNELDEIAPILRVDGDLWFFEFEGCEKLRLSKKYRYITIDIGMPLSKWAGKSPLEIRVYLVENLKQALNIIMKRLRKEKMAVNEELLMDDFSKVEKDLLEYLLNGSR